MINLVFVFYIWTERISTFATIAICNATNYAFFFRFLKRSISSNSKNRVDCISFSIISVEPCKSPRIQYKGIEPENEM